MRIRNLVNCLLLFLLIRKNIITLSLLQNPRLYLGLFTFNPYGVAQVCRRLGFESGYWTNTTLNPVGVECE
jgi:hypothetical protein